VRDAQIAELNAAEPPANLPHEATADSSIDTAALVTRLEQLLDEAERSDERIRVMEDLLRAADEANQAEQEERRELEAWVSDIEKRIGQRESEWQAEMATLEHRLQVVTAERDQVERRLQLAASPDTAKSESDGALTQLRQQNRELDEKLQTARKLYAELEKRLAQLDDQDSPRAQQAAIEEALREERAKLAQERASVTRMRAEITAKLAEAQAVAGNRSTEIESRLRMYREHLKEIHDNEKDGRPAKVERTLSARISRIWKQLDG
jgi:chromosome segregation ATPase